MLMNIKSEYSYMIDNPFNVKYVLYNNHFIAFLKSLFKKEK